MTYDPIFMLIVFKLKDQNYSLNNIVKHLKVVFNHEGKTPNKSIIVFTRYKLLNMFFHFRALNTIYLIYLFYPIVVLFQLFAVLMILLFYVKK